MKKLYYALLLLLLIGYRGLIQNKGGDIFFINREIIINNYEIKRILNKQSELYNLKQGIEKGKLPYMYLHKNDVVFLSKIKDTIPFSLIKYSIYTTKLDSIRKYGYIYPNGLIETKYSTTDWILTGDKKSVSKIKYLKGDSLTKGKNFKNLLEELYQKSEFTDYTDFEFRFYIPPQMYIIENIDRRQYPQEYMEKNFPVKQGKDAGFVDFKFPEEEKYLKILKEEKYTEFPEQYMQQKAEEAYPDNKEKQKMYIKMHTRYLTKTYAELKMPKENIRFKYDRAKLQFFENEELYKQGILFIYLEGTGSEQQGLYVIRPKS